MTIVSLSALHAREGLTLDALVRVVRATVLSPALSWVLPVLAALRHSAAQFLPGALEALRAADWLSLVKVDRATQLALAVFGLSVVLSANDQLSRAARNNLTRGKKPWDWHREIVVITGGAGGLGTAVANRLVARGTKVVVLDVAPLSGPETPGLSYYQVDLSSADAVKAVARKVQDKVGHPSVLINMAGVVRATSILEMTERDVDLTYDINVKAHYWTVQAFLPHMIQEGHGHVITISSSTAYIAAATGVAYCSSKVAALSFHEGLTEELRHLYQPASHARAVRTSVICPAHFKSAMFAGFENLIPQRCAPSLEVETVAELVEQTVLSGESQHIIEPFYAKCTPFGRALPTWLYSIVLFCAKDAMGAVRAFKAREAKQD
ncbi:hypothetical protein Rhopal_000618-T1 [Rhodotorula paludigena]|uniref:Short-chain dehydrogenase/reductase 3 n=1 Tax=Rhodotorula paludigena TaxID=86838 RepID=A0AAV5GBJ0_9BASI|nr:hypothetical protein Rhopal_000618-T1 [Rhodotorula paludigena]